MPSFLNADHSFYPAARPPQVVAPATGNTVRMSDQTLYVQQTGTLAALTVLLPSNPQQGQMANIVPGNTITALTVQTASGGAVAGAPTAGVANTRITMQYLNGAWVWVK